MDYRDLLRESWRRRNGPADERAGASRRDPRAPGLPDPGEGAGPSSAAPSGPTGPTGLRRRLHDRFLREIELQGAVDTADRTATRERVRRLVDRTLSGEELAALSARDRAQLEDEVMAEILGLGPLAPLFADPTVSDVLVNGPNEVWVDRFGRLELTEVRFDDEAHLMRLLGRLVSDNGRHLDEASPHVDFRLSDGTRLHALIPPLCSTPVVSVRRVRSIPFHLEELVACDTLSPAMGELLRAAVRARLNILISGGTGSGKTTLLNVLSGFIPAEERVISIEETAELRLEHPHVVALEARLPNIEEKGEVTLRTLVKNSLRMRPDRIIVGEVRGPEAFDMLQAMNTGHQGSLTTVHANTPEDALRRLENLVLMGGFELPTRAIRELLGAAFDLIVQLQRFPEGTRRVVAIEEVALEAGELRNRELFRFDGAEAAGGVDGGRYAATGHRPHFLARLARAGLDAGSVFSPGNGPGGAPD